MPDSDRSLPPRPSLEQQKKRAKELLQAFHRGDASASARVRRQLPDRASVSLADAQFVIAREYGFESWATLKTHISLIRAGIPESVREAFTDACRARDADALRRLLERQPAARAMIDAPLLPFDSPALVHFAEIGELALINVLLDFGADPNRRSEWWAGGFHALHTARGDVADRLIEAGAVPDACAAAHLDRIELLRAILDADPARVHERGGDGQTPLHFARSRQVVDLLLSRGADIDARDVDHRATPAQWMLDRTRGAGRYALAAYLVERGASADVFLAAALGLTFRLREILDADPSLVSLRTGQGEYGERPPSSFHIYTWTIGQNVSPLQTAAFFGQDAAAAVLSAFADPKQLFLAACSAAREAEARELLRETPGRVGELTHAEMRALPDAGWAENAAAVDLMLTLGFDPATPGQDGGTVLHCAAWQGSAPCIEAALRHPGVAELINAPDPTHGGTPLGWCCHGARHRQNPNGDYLATARLLLRAGARPGHNIEDAPPDLLAVITAESASR